MKELQIVVSRRQVGQTKRMIEEANESGATILVRSDARKAQMEARGAMDVRVLKPAAEIPGSLAQMKEFFNYPNP